MLRYVLAIPTFKTVFIMNGCGILLNAFLASIEMIVVFVFSFVDVVYHID